MAQKDIDTFNARVQKIAAEARAAKAVNNPQALADFEQAVDDLQSEQRRTAVEDKNSNRPSTVEATREAAIEQLRADQSALEGLLALQTVKAEEIEAELLEVRKASVRAEMPARSGGKPILTRELQRTLLQTRSDAPEIVQMQQSSDELVMLNAMIAHKAGRSHIFPNLPRDVRKTKTFERHVKNLEAVYSPESVRALYSTGANLGDELVPLELSATVYEKFEMERKLAAAIPSFNMIRGEYKFPLTTANPTVYLQSERTADPGSDYRASDLSTDQRTFACATFAALQNISSEIEEDSITPIAPLWSSGVAKAMAATEEDVIINGDDASTHLDSDVTASDDARKAFDGIRRFAATLTSTPTSKDLSSWAVNANATFVAMVAAMGDWSSDPSKLLCIPSTSVFWKLLVDNDRIVSAEKVGSLAAPILTGKVPYFFGIPVLVSGKVRRNLNNSGVYDGSTVTQTQVLVIKPDAYLIGRRRALNVRAQEDVPSGQTALVATMRFKLNKMESTTTGLTECVGYKITA